MTHLDPEVLALFAGGELPEAEARAVAEHVGGCEACSRAVAEMRATLADFRAWAAEDGSPTTAETQGLHAAVLERLPGRRHFWASAGAVAATAAVMVICGIVVLWAPWADAGKHQRARVQPPSLWRPGDTAAASVKATTAGLARSQDRPDARLSASLKPAIPYSGEATARTQTKGLAPGMRNVALKHDADGEPMLEIATANPNVVILWYVDEGNKKDDDE